LRTLQREAGAEVRWAKRSLYVGLFLVLFTFAGSFLVRLFGFTDPNFNNYQAILQSPSWAHPLGTDDLGRDMLTRVAYGSHVDFEVAILATLGSLLIGVSLGAVAGYVGGIADRLVMRVADIVLAFPLLIFMIAIIALLGVGMVGVYVGLISFGWAMFARLTRADLLVVREQPYIRAAEGLGIGRLRVLVVHALPNAVRPCLVYSCGVLVHNILTLATLSFLGLGVQPPKPELGALIAQGQHLLLTGWWVATLPGLVVLIIGVGFSMIGDALSDISSEHEHGGT
jgi:peptide/nickel transport system permease protein